MPVIVQKYGGSSVGSPEKIKKVAKRIVDSARNKNQVIVVVSAIGDTTDELIELVKKINLSPAKREYDMVLSTGEVVSSALMAMAVQDLGKKAIALTGTQIGMRTDIVHTKAKIMDIDTKRLKDELKKGNIIIVAGFQGINEFGDITTLGRGGSDTTAVAIAAAVKADKCEIYTDVDGIYTTDPRVVPEAKKLSRICYDEILEMASLGAGVMQSRSIEFAKKFNVEVEVKNSMTNAKGTMITKEEKMGKEMEKFIIKGVAADERQSKITIINIPDIPGVAGKIFSELGKSNINVDMIIQTSPIALTQTNNISFTLPRGEEKEALDTLKKISKNWKKSSIKVDKNIAKVSIVGVGMKSHPGVAGRMFAALGKNKINIQMISTSEIKISCAISEKDIKKAVRALHKEFIG